MILTLCGSARFEPWFHFYNEILTLAGHTVFSLACFPSVKGAKGWYTAAEKLELDAAHLRKIDASDGIVVLNPWAYIGESTLREIRYADTAGKLQYFLGGWGKGCGISENHTESHRAAAATYLTSGGVVTFSASPIDTFAAGSRRNLHWSHDLWPSCGPSRSKLVSKVDNFRAEYEGLR